jgi:hypothetical protein
VGEVVVVASQAPDPGADPGAVEAEQRAEPGPGLSAVQGGDERPLGALGHQGAVQLRREPGERRQVEGARAGALGQEAGELLAPARGDHDLGTRLDVGLQQRGHTRGRIRLAVRGALVLKMPLGRLREQHAAVRADDRQRRVVEGSGETEVEAHEES